MTTENSNIKYPLLSSIDSPSDLRKVPVDQLPQVCSEIRQFLINSLSGNPGHIASSMGVVEITVALHYVFNTPYDRIVWDVGHQAYGHKILTGRRDRFSTNRKFGGISGFPNPAESEYDTFTAGHASNSISAALGMAIASALSNENPRRNVVAVIGDASISGGLAFEGINNAANVRNNMLIILNDNDMSIDKNVGSLNSYLAHLTTSKGYNNIRDILYRGLRKFSLIGDKQKGAILRFNNSLKALLTREQNIFEGLNIRYFGPFDGHDLPTVIKVLSDIKDMNGPRILHLRTQKGRGFAAAEADPATWHAPGIFDPRTGERPCSSPSSQPAKYQTIFGKTITELAEGNRDIVGITAAMPSGTSMNIMQKVYPERVFDVGISEGHAVTFAGGLAKEGKKPFVAIYSSFLQRAYDHIIHDVAIQELPVTFCIDRSGLVGEDGVTHHGLYDIAYLRTIPGMIISSPRNQQQMRDLIFTASQNTRYPFAIRYPRGSSSEIFNKTPMAKVDLMHVDRISDGNDIILLTAGPICAEAENAVKILSEKNISVCHISFPYIKPLNGMVLKELAERNLPIVTLEDAARNGGFGSAITEWMEDNGYLRRIRRLGVPDCFITHGSVRELYKLCGMDAESVAAVLEEEYHKAKQN